MFLVDGIGDEWACWSAQFAELWSSSHAPKFFHDRCVSLLEGSESLAAAYSLFVPHEVPEYTFWCRYMNARRCILPREHALFLLEKDSSTFTCEPIGTDFHDWKSIFIGDWDRDDGGIVSDCIVAMEQSELLSWQYNRLVPSDICAQDFWSRYLFRRALLLRNVPNAELPQSPTLPIPLRNDGASAVCEVASDESRGEKNSSSDVPNAEVDGNDFSLSQTTGSAPVDASLPGSVAFLSEPHVPDGSISSTHAVLSSTIAQSAVPSNHNVQSSSHIALQEPSSSEGSVRDEWQRVEGSSHIPVQGLSSSEEDGWDKWE